MTEKIRLLPAGKAGSRGMLLFLVLLMTAGLTVTALLAGKSIEMEQRASDLSRAVLIAASASDIYYEADDPESFSDILETQWNFREAGTARAADEAVFEDPEGFQIRIRYGGDGRLESAEIRIFRNGTELYSLSCKKAGKMTEEGTRWNAICTA